MKIEGKAIAEGIIEKIRNKSRGKTKKFIGALLIGDNSASLSFLDQKEIMAKGLGIEFRRYSLPQNITTDELRHEIGRFASPKACGGFIVQLPLPEGINRRYVLNAIPEKKDVDVLSERAFASFLAGNGDIVPPSVGTVDEIFKKASFDTALQSIAIIGKGILVGAPVAAWLQGKNIEFSVFDSKTENLHKRLEGFDCVISGVGKPGLFSAQHLKKAALVIDFGFYKDEKGKIHGDFDSRGAEEKGIIYTPTPSGTGPILVAKLFENFWKLNS